MPIKSPILNPKAVKGWVSRDFALGTASYDLDSLYSPDTGYEQSKVLDLASPKYEPNKTRVFDKSRYNNHGTITGATWARLPSGLWVLNFDGDDYVNCGTGVPINTSTGYACWYYNNTVAGLHGIMSKQTGGGATVKGLYLYQSTLALLVVINDGVDGHRADQTIGGVFSTSAWRFVWLTCVSGTLTLGVNTTSLTVDISAIGDIETGTNFYIGTLDGTNWKANGRIALERVLTLTPSQALNIHNRERHLFGV